MRNILKLRAPLLCAAASFAIALPAADASVRSPKTEWGNNVGDDYFLPNYTQMTAYFAKLAKESDRMKILSIGHTVEGRDLQLLVVSSPANLAKLDHYRAISGQLARAEGLTEAQARALAEEGKAIVWIDAGIHTTEVAGTDQMIETIYQLLDRDDAETRRMLDDVIILFAHCNPDGQEMVSDWYMRRKVPETRKKEVLPSFDKKWIGQESNRDYFMANMPESEGLARALYIDWLPQISYNHHAATYPGAVVAAPPFRDPFNFTYDPLVMTSLDAVAAAMNNRWVEKDMPGATQRTGHPYSTWWNGGVRNTGYYHNIVGVLTEIMGYPTPVPMPMVPYRLQPKGENPFPVPPGGTWHYRRTIDYLVEANKAVIDYASKNRTQVLYNSYLMGTNSIKRGNEDYWTPYPKRQQAILDAYAKDQSAAGKTTTASADQGYVTNQALSATPVPIKYFDQVMKDLALRDPRGFILPSDQADFGTVVKFVNALIKTGLQVQKATQDFTVAGKSYPAGSYVVKTDQAFRPHVLDMFEPQDYPNDFAIPGGPPTPPYDSAGWTLAYEMGLKFDRVLDGFDGPFEKLAIGKLEKVPATGIEGQGKAGWILAAEQNDSFMLVNRLLKAGVAVQRLRQAGDGYAAGAFFVPANAKAAPIVSTGTTELGLRIKAVDTAPAGAQAKLAAPRVAVWDKYGGTAPGGWVRWLLGEYGFGDRSIYSQEIDAGNLRKKYDVLIFASDAIPPAGIAAKPDHGSEHAGTIPTPAEMPAKYRGWLGWITADKSIPQLRKFVEQGGTIVTLGSSGSLASHLGLPVENMLTEVVDGKRANLPTEKFYVPGSILHVALDSSQPESWGMPAETDVFFESGKRGAKATDYVTPVFRLTPQATAAGITPIAWFKDGEPLRSGWAWGQGHLAQGVAAFRAPIGQGNYVAFAPQIAFRGQTHGTYKLLFNSLYEQGAKAAR